MPSGFFPSPGAILKMKRAITLVKIKDHGQLRYQIWEKCDKRQKAKDIYDSISITMRKMKKKTEKIK
jgi:hypothetical protein